MIKKNTIQIYKLDFRKTKNKICLNTTSFFNSQTIQQLSVSSFLITFFNRLVFNITRELNELPSYMSYKKEQ